MPHGALPEPTRPESVGRRRELTPIGGHLKTGVTSQEGHPRCDGVQAPMPSGVSSSGRPVGPRWAPAACGRARDRGPSPEALRHGGPREEIDRSQLAGLTAAVREELRRLGRENRILREDREILKSRRLLRLGTEGHGREVPVRDARTGAPPVTPGAAACWGLHERVGRARRRGPRARARRRAIAGGQKRLPDSGARWGSQETAVAGGLLANLPACNRRCGNLPGPPVMPRRVLRARVSGVGATTGISPKGSLGPHHARSTETAPGPA